MKSIPEMIASRESEEIEFKTSFGKEVIETLCAFANHKGGWVNQIKQSTIPSIIPDIELSREEGKGKEVNTGRSGY